MLSFLFCSPNKAQLEHIWQQGAPHRAYLNSAGVAFHARRHPSGWGSCGPAPASVHWGYPTGWHSHQLCRRRSALTSLPFPPSCMPCLLPCLHVRSQSNQVQCHIEEACLALHACASACLHVAPGLGQPADVSALAHASHNMHMSHACTPACRPAFVLSPWAGRCAARTRSSPLELVKS